MRPIAKAAAAAAAERGGGKEEEEEEEGEDVYPVGTRVEMLFDDGVWYTGAPPTHTPTPPHPAYCEWRCACGVWYRYSGSVASKWAALLLLY